MPGGGTGGGGTGGAAPVRMARPYGKLCDNAGRCAEASANQTNRAQKNRA
ncbi:MAG: hypothetical protein OXU61_02725 [Gammaproteobacteria bacterium]|nr:hypothetical protein [Gammaproteobacteria bacterium]